MVTASKRRTSFSLLRNGPIQGKVVVSSFFTGYYPLRANSYDSSIFSPPSLYKLFIRRNILIRRCNRLQLKFICVHKFAPQFRFETANLSIPNISLRSHLRHDGSFSSKF